MSNVYSLRIYDTELMRFSMEKQGLDVYKRQATGDYDAIIIGHSQFEKIPMSVERQQAILERQIEEILEGIEQAKAQKAERYTVKQMERTRKSLETKLAKLNDQSRKDDTVTFEQLGVEDVYKRQGRDGGTESQRPDEMGGSDEQSAGRGGGNGAGRTDLQLIEEPEESAGGEQLPALLDEKQIMAIIANKDDDLKYKKQQIELFRCV